MSLVENKVPKSVYRYIVLLFLIVVCVRIVLTTRYNNNYGGIEQNVVYGIQRVLMGQALYQNPATGSYAVMQYTPLYYYFTASVARCIGINALNVYGLYVLCRILAFVFNLLTVLIAALIIRSWRFQWLYSFVFAMPVLLLLTWHYYTRGDSMHLFLFVSAIYSYLLYHKNGGLHHLLLAALYTGGCIMTKQSGILAAGIIGCSLLFTSRKYLATLLYGLCIFSVAYLIAAACIQGQWHALYQNTWLGLKNGVDLSFLYNIFVSQFYTDMVPCYVLGGIIVWLAIKKITDKTYRVIAIGAALSFLFAITTGLKIGSSNNYFTEFLFFVVIALPYLLQSETAKMTLFKLFGYTITIRHYAYIAFFILITSKTIGLFSAVYIEKSIKDYSAEYTAEEKLYQYVTQQLNIQNGEYIFFTGRLFLDNLFIKYAIMPTKDVVAQVYAADHNTYDYAYFSTHMNTGLVKYIITTENSKDINEWNSSIPFLLFDKNKFKLLTHYLGYTIYVYAP